MTIKNFLLSFDWLFRNANQKKNEKREEDLKKVYVSGYRPMDKKLLLKKF